MASVSCQNARKNTKQVHKIERGGRGGGGEGREREHLFFLFGMVLNKELICFAHRGDNVGMFTHTYLRN